MLRLLDLFRRKPSGPVASPADFQRALQTLPGAMVAGRDAETPLLRHVPFSDTTTYHPLFLQEAERQVLTWRKRAWNSALFHIQRWFR